MTEEYNAKSLWNTVYGDKSKRRMAYPSEYVIRILKGTFPKLSLEKSQFKSSKFCDLGCGDGRNIALAKECGFDVSGMEITPEIVENVKLNLSEIGIRIADIRVGTNDNIPFHDNAFDYTMSWNSSYYMGTVGENFDKYVKEFARITKSGGHLILSIPKKTCFIFNKAENLGNGYCIIKDDYFDGLRNGELFRLFENEKEIEATFSPYFEHFEHASIHDDCFGLEYHWHLCVCKKK